MQNLRYGVLTIKLMQNYDDGKQRGALYPVLFKGQLNG